MFVPRFSLVSMTLLNIEPLSINTHMQTGPTLPRSSPRGPRPATHIPPPSMIAASSGQPLQAREGSRKKERNKEREKSTSKTYWERQKQRGEWRHWERNENIREENERRRRLGFLTNVYGVRYRLPLPSLTFPSQRLGAVLGAVQRIFPPLSMSVPKIYRHEAAGLQRLHHISASIPCVR